MTEPATTDATVNDTRVLSHTALHAGDEIRLGPCKFIFDTGDDPQWSQRFLQDDIDPVARTARVPPGQFSGKGRGVE